MPGVGVQDRSCLASFLASSAQATFMSQIYKQILDSCQPAFASIVPRSSVHVLHAACLSGTHTRTAAAAVRVGTLHQSPHTVRTLALLFKTE